MKYQQLWLTTTTHTWNTSNYDSLQPFTLELPATMTHNNHSYINYQQLWLTTTTHTWNTSNYDSLQPFTLELPATMTHFNHSHMNCQQRWQFFVIFTLTWRLSDFRDFSPTFKPLIIYLNLVCNVIALTEYSDFNAFWLPRFHTCDVTTVLDPRHLNSLTWPLADCRDFYRRLSLWLYTWILCVTLLY